jgi:hypothetical protein
MVRKLDEGMDVTSTFFDPALIGTSEHRARFVQETLTHLGSITAIDDVFVDQGMRVLPDGADALLVITDATVSEVEVWSTSGSLLRTMSGGGRTSVHVELTGVAAGQLPARRAHRTGSTDGAWHRALSGEGDHLVRPSCTSQCVAPSASLSVWTIQA